MCVSVGYVCMGRVCVYLLGMFVSVGYVCVSVGYVCVGRLCVCIGRVCVKRHDTNAGAVCR